MLVTHKNNPGQNKFAYSHSRHRWYVERENVLLYQITCDRRKCHNAWCDLCVPWQCSTQLEASERQKKRCLLLDSRFQFVRLKGSPFKRQCSVSTLQDCHYTEQVLSLRLACATMAEFGMPMRTKRRHLSQDLMARII